MKKICFSLLCLLFFGSAVASDRTTTQMKKIAADKLSGLNVNRNRGAAGSVNVENLQCAISNDVFNVYKNDNGFVIVSRDDKYPAVIAYGAGDFSIADMHSSVKWWLEAAQKAMRNGTYQYSKRAESTVVSPLLTTKWGQSSPYNNYAPALKLYDLQKAPAGCVAIAMAQIMNFNKYPASASFTGIYYQEGDETEYTEEVNSTYSWPYKDYYNYYFPEGSTEYVKASYTPRQGNMVATLCRDCAYSVEMNYTIDGSGAMLTDAISAFIEKFSYPETTRLFFKDLYTGKEWKPIVYNELAIGSPILYSGYDSNTGAGHAFVADGVDEEGLLHINWGWNGSYDGYYDMDVLEYEDNENFSDSQMIITGIRPTSLESDVFGSVMGLDEIYSFSYNNEKKLFIFDEKGIYNYCGKTIDGRMGIVVEDANNPDNVDCIDFLDEGEVLESLYGFGAYQDSLELTLPAGSYKLYFGSKDKRETEWQKARVYGIGAIYYEMTVADDGTVSIGKTPIYASPGGGETAIKSIKSDVDSNKQYNRGVYDLRGQYHGKSLNGLRKGMYIVNGQKVVK